MINYIKENQDKFDMYYDFLIKENNKYNLTAITEKSEVNIKHFYDSIALKDTIDLNQINSICDIGSGAGFPSIPIKICFDHLKVTIIEPTLKRVKFLEELVRLLELDNVKIINARAEDIAIEYKEQFDLVTGRAVAQLPILLELLCSFCKVKGKIVAYKGDKGKQELIESKNAMNVLDCSLEKIYEYDLPSGSGKRDLIIFTKEKETNKKYPRRYAEIKKKPL